MSDTLDKLLKRQAVNHNDTPKESTVVLQPSIGHSHVVLQPSTNELIRNPLGMSQNETTEKILLKSDKQSEIDYLKGLSQTQRIDYMNDRIKQNALTKKLDKPKDNTLRKCPRCEETKELEQFRTKKGNTFHSYCRQCKKEYSKGYRLTGMGYKALFGDGTE